MNCPWEEKKNGKSVYVESEQVSEVKMNYINQLVKPKKRLHELYPISGMNFKSLTSINLYLDLKDDWKQPIFFRLHQKYQLTVVWEILAIYGIFFQLFPRIYSWTSCWFFSHFKSLITVSSLAKFCLGTYN